MGPWRIKRSAGRCDGKSSRGSRGSRGSRRGASTPATTLGQSSSNAIR
jgi:hypothetical protein